MDAPAPFDSSAISDTVIRTSDNIHFYVLGAFLYYVSETFRDKLSLNRDPLASSERVLPVLDFSEDSQIFSILLELIYPRIDEPQFHDLEVFKRVSKAAQAYSMSVVEKKLKKQNVTSLFIKAEPFRLYAIAIDLGWEEVALVAARATLKIPLKELAFVDELQDISGAGFYRFLNYRFRCDASGDASKETLGILTRRPPSDKGAKKCLTGAQGPFVPSSNGNLILRSSDLVNFFITEGLIRFVSPFFDGKFPLKDCEELDGRPVIVVPERSEALRGLLNIIYPSEDDPDMPDCDLYGEMVRAARKLEISVVKKKLEKQGMALAHKEPLRMYAIATDLGMVEVAKIAALNTFSQPLRDMTFVDELDEITGADLFRLLRFRFKCAEAVRNVVRDSKVHTERGFGDLQRHMTLNGYCLSSECSLPDKLLRRLEDCPRGDTYRAIYLSDIACRLGYLDPSSCSISLYLAAFNAMEMYRNGLVAAIEDAVSKVSLTDTLKFNATEDGDAKVTATQSLEDPGQSTLCRCKLCTRCSNEKGGKKKGKKNLKK